MKKVLSIVLLLLSTMAISQTARTTTLNNKLKLTQTPNLSVVDSILSKDASQVIRSTSFDAFKTQLGLGSFLENVVEDLTPQLGGNFGLNNFNISGIGNISNTGNMTTSGILQGLDLIITNDVQFSNYANTRVDATAVNFLHTDITGNLLSSPVSSLLTGTNTGDDAFNSSSDLRSKNYSWGESYITNWRDEVLDDGATYFPNSGGYEIGVLHQADLQPSLHLIPAAVQTDSLYIVRGSKNFTVDRASLATYVDENGIIREAGFDVARIDYTDVDGVVLTEPQSTNLITFSEDFSNTGWIDAECTITTNTALAPDGTMTADTMTPDVSGNSTTSGNGSGSNRLFKQTGGSVAAGEYTNSIYVKSVSGLPFDLSIYVQFGDVIVGITTIAVTNEWRRVDTQGTIPSQIIRFTVLSEEEVYIWGAQLEESSIATSYIKTEGTTVTRLADQITDAGTVNDFNSEEGVLYAEIAGLVNGLTGNNIITLSDGTSNNRLFINYHNTAGRIQVGNIVSGVSTASMETFAFDKTSLIKLAVKYKLNEWALYINGSEIDTDTSSSVWSTNTLDILSYDEGTGTNPFFGKTKSIQVFKTALSDQELEDLTKL